MKITLHQINLSVIDFEIKSNGTSILEDVTNLNGKLDEGLIENIEEVLQELKDYDEKWKEKNEPIKTNSDE